MLTLGNSEGGFFFFFFFRKAQTEMQFKVVYIRYNVHLNNIYRYYKPQIWLNVISKHFDLIFLHRVSLKVWKNWILYNALNTLWVNLSHWLYNYNVSLSPHRRCDFICDEQKVSVSLPCCKLKNRSHFFSLLQYLSWSSDGNLAPFKQVVFFFFKWASVPAC